MVFEENYLSKGEPMCHYTHLTPFEREKILFFLTDGKSVTEIAHLLKPQQVDHLA
jgi:hypothetical protein